MNAAASDSVPVELHGQVQGPVFEVSRLVGGRDGEVEEGRRSCRCPLAESGRLFGKIIFVVVVQLFAVDDRVAAVVVVGVGVVVRPFVDVVHVEAVQRFPIFA